jgi:hypothetical protein
MLKAPRGQPYISAEEGDNLFSALDESFNIKEISALNASGEIMIKTDITGHSIQLQRHLYVFPVSGDNPIPAITTRR